MKRPVLRKVVEERLRNLRLAREHAGLSQVDLAERIGVTQHTISRIETGAIANPSDDLKLRIAVALDADLNTLFGWPHWAMSMALHDYVEFTPSEAA